MIESEESKELFLEKTNHEKLKNPKHSISGPLKFAQNEFSTKIGLCHFLASTVPYFHVKNLKKLMS